MNYTAAIIGAAGFAGAELTRRLIEHPSFDLKVITSDSDAGSRLDEMYPAFAGISELTFASHDDSQVSQCDVAFLAVPHTAAMSIAPKLIEAGVTVIDLSADFRLKDPAIYEAWYGLPHAAPSLLAQSAFGLPEITGDELAEAAIRRSAGIPALIACAGCYPTATGLAAFPAVHAGLTQGAINVHAVSGVTGAGRKSSSRTHFCNANENVEAYGVGTHRHTPEMEQILGTPDRVVFVPHLVPMSRGILSTASMQIIDDDFTLGRAHRLYSDFYAGSAFVHVLPLGSQPRTASVAGSNHAHIGLGWREATRTLVVTSAIDNLGKGAADQAVQCANIVFGLPETCGIATMALPV